MLQDVRSRLEPLVGITCRTLCLGWVVSRTELFITGRNDLPSTMPELYSSTCRVPGVLGKLSHVVQHYARLATTTEQHRKKTTMSVPKTTH